MRDSVIRMLALLAFSFGIVCLGCKGSKAEYVVNYVDYRRISDSLRNTFLQKGDPFFCYRRGLYPTTTVYYFLLNEDSCKVFKINQTEFSLLKSPPQTWLCPNFDSSLIDIFYLVRKPVVHDGKILVIHHADKFYIELFDSSRHLKSSWAYYELPYNVVLEKFILNLESRLLSLELLNPHFWVVLKRPAIKLRKKR